MGIIDFNEIESLDQLKSYDNYHFLIALLNPLYEKEATKKEETKDESVQETAKTSDAAIPMILT